MSDDEDRTSAGVPWREVPEFARHHVAWMDGSHGSAPTALPSLDVVPVPEALKKLPRLHENRPRGSKAMIDAAGAGARLREVRPGAWLISRLPAGNGQNGQAATSVGCPLTSTCRKASACFHETTSNRRSGTCTDPNLRWG